MFMIKKPTKEAEELFKKLVGRCEIWSDCKLMMNGDHTMGLFIDSMTFNDLARIFNHDVLKGLGKFRFNGIWLKRKRKNYGNIAIDFEIEGETKRIFIDEKLLQIAVKTVTTNITNNVWLCVTSEKNYDRKMLIVRSNGGDVLICQKITPKSYRPLNEIAKKIEDSHIYIKNPENTSILELLSEDEINSIIIDVEQLIGD